MALTRRSIEPTTPKGLHRYIDLVYMLPEHIQSRPDLIKVVQLFQDYLNDGYRKIPQPTRSVSYKNESKDSNNFSDTVKTYTEQIRPLNHDTSMYSRRILGAIDYSTYDMDAIEDYDKERDLSTWAIDDDVMDGYKLKHSNILLGDSNNLYSYYNEGKIYYSPSVFFSRLNSVASENDSNQDVFNNIFMFFSQHVRDSSITIDESSMSLDEMVSMIPDYTDLPSITFTYYACDATSMLEDFDNLFNPGSSPSSDVQPLFKVEHRKINFFYGISKQEDEYGPTSFASNEYLNVNTFRDSINTQYNKSFRVSIKFNSGVSKSSIMESFVNRIRRDHVGTFAFTVHPRSLVDVVIFSHIDTPIIASALTVIREYEHPDVFYSYFEWQNTYRHEVKGASLVEKIHRLAYAKDPNVVDFEYIGLVAQHFGYSLETGEQEINLNDYYKTIDEKESAIRNLVKSMPEFNRMKGTDSGIEMVLLSFGLVGRIVTLFTRGDSKSSGYADFIDSRTVSGDIEEYVDANDIVVDSNFDESEVSMEMSRSLTTNISTVGTSIYDWYACPHFRIEFDVLKDYLNIVKGLDQFRTIAKTVRKVKPINTVFQGFYAKLSASYGYIFLNKPKYINKVKLIKLEESSCHFIDDWRSQCAIDT